MANWALIGIVASLLAGAMTGIGGGIVALGRAPDMRRQNLLMGFAAGVMIAAAFFSLIIPGIVLAQRAGQPPWTATASVAAAVWFGILAMGCLSRAVNSAAQRRTVRQMLGHRPDQSAHLRAALAIAAITLHNLPEGMAVGVSFMSGDPRIGLTTAVGIGVQNIPEGLAVAAVLASLGWSRWRCAALALCTGLVEPIGGAIGVGLAQISYAVLPWALGCSAGAMLFVVAAEILPHVRRRIEHGSATPAVMVGLAVMMFLDLSLG